jgi:hypothetical protein
MQRRQDIGLFALPWITIPWDIMLAKIIGTFEKTTLDEHFKTFFQTEIKTKYYLQQGWCHSFGGEVKFVEWDNKFLM